MITSASCAPPGWCAAWAARRLLHTNAVPKSRLLALQRMHNISFTLHDHAHADSGVAVHRRMTDGGQQSSLHSQPRSATARPFCAAGQHGALLCPACCRRSSRRLSAPAPGLRCHTSSPGTHSSTAMHPVACTSYVSQVVHCHLELSSIDCMIVRPCRLAASVDVPGIRRDGSAFISKLAGALVSTFQDEGGPCSAPLLLCMKCQHTSVPGRHMCLQLPDTPA